MIEKNGYVLKFTKPTEKENPVTREELMEMIKKAVIKKLEDVLHEARADKEFLEQQIMAYRKGEHVGSRQAKEYIENYQRGIERIEEKLAMIEGARANFEEESRLLEEMATDFGRFSDKERGQILTELEDRSADFVVALLSKDFNPEEFQKTRKEMSNVVDLDSRRKKAK